MNIVENSVFILTVNVPRSCDLSPHCIRTPRKRQAPAKNYQDPDTKSRRGLDEISTRSYNNQESPNSIKSRRDIHIRSRLDSHIKISSRYPSQISTRHTHHYNISTHLDEIHATIRTNLDETCIRSRARILHTISTRMRVDLVQESCCTPLTPTHTI